MANLSNTTNDRSRDIGSISGELSDASNPPPPTPVDMARIERAVR
jgi:hypothetical protein